MERGFFKSSGKTEYTYRRGIRCAKQQIPKRLPRFFQPIEGDANEVLFRTAEYISTGYFHNSQITAVDHVKKTVTFKYKSWVDRGTREKSFKTRTMDLYSFMGRMLFFLPEKNRKMIRYYGIYAHKLDEKIKKIKI